MSRRQQQETENGLQYPHLPQNDHHHHQQQQLQQQQQQQQQQQLQQQQRQPQQQYQSMEEIPLRVPINRSNSRQETEERQKLRQIFDKHDTNSDGYINIRELKGLIGAGVCRDIPLYITDQILQLSDRNTDGQLDFEEFYHMSQQNRWLLKNVIRGYCRMVVPPPHRVEGDQIDGAYERQMTFCPPPLTMIIFSIIEVIMFLIDIIYFQDDPNNNQRKVGESTSGPAATAFIYNPYKRYEAWRFVSYMFVHVGIMHLFMNLVIQIFLGVALELVHHWWRVALVYLAGVAAGSMGTSLSSPRIFLAGASGGVYALITAHIATIIMNWSEMEFAIVQLFVFLIFCFTDLGTSIYRHITDQYDQIGYMAHLSGAIAGLLVGIGVLRNLKVRRWERILWWIAVIFYFALMFTGILIHLLVPNYFPRQEFA